MSPRSNRLWQCGNHIPVHLALGRTQRDALTHAFQCQRWRHKKLNSGDDNTPAFIGVTWKCGNHSNPTHVARTQAERRQFTRTENCTNWSTGFVD